MEYDIKDKRAIVTGGADGIGYAIAEKFLQRGAAIIILIDINETKGVKSTEKLNKTYGTGKAVYIQCDVTNDLESVFEVVIKKYKRIDVLVNSAGINDGSIPKRIIGINATAVAEWSLKFYEHMRTDKDGKGGTILNMSSIFGYRVAPVGVLYQMTKFAVQGFTRSLGHECNFKNTGVRVIALCPGFTYTNMNANIKAALAGDDSKSELISKDVIKFIRGHLWQEVETVGEAALEIFQNAKSGTAWLIEGGKPIEEILHHE